MKTTVRAICLSVLLALAGCDLFVSSETRIQRAEQYLEVGNERGALIELSKVLDEEATNARARVLLAHALYRLGDPDGARGEAQRALQLGAAPSELAEVYTNVLLMQREYDEAEKWLSSGELGLPKTTHDMLLARTKLGQGNTEEAERILQAALQAEPSVEVQCGLAEVFAAKGDRARALAQLDEALADDPQHAKALLMKGSLLMQSGRLDAAEQAYVASLEHGSTRLTLPQKVLATAAQVEIHLARGDIEGAQRVHKQLDALAPGSAVAKLLSARILLSKQDYSAASAELQRVVSQMPQLVAARALLGSALYAQGSYEQAERHLTEVVRQAPANIEARKLLAQLRLRKNQPAEAMNVLVPAFDQDTVDSEVSALVNAAQLQMGHDASTVPLLERSVQQHPENTDLKLQLASAYLLTGNSDKAVTLLRQIERKGNDASKEALLVAALADSKGLAAAQQEVESLIKAHPQDVAILNLASSFFLRRGDFERARAMLARATAVDPANVSTKINAGRLELAAGKPNVAEAHFREALKLDSDNAAAHLGLAEIALRQGQGEAALEWLKTLATRQPKAVEPRLMLARLYLQQKEPASAEKAIEEALSISPDKARIQNAAGLIYMQFGRFDAALSAFRAAAEGDNSNAEYLINQARAERALGQTEAAQTTAARALAVAPDSIAAVAMNAFLDLEAKRPQAALARLDALKKQRPKDPAVAVLEGELLMELERYEQAAAAFARAAQMRDSAIIAIKLSQARRRAGMANALEPLESWVSRNPEDLTVRRVLASAYQASGANAKALAEYEVLVSQAPADALALNNLAWLRYEAGDPRAEQAGARAYELASDNPAVADTYGWILLQKGDTARALPVLEKAASMTNQPDIQYHHAAALAKSGKRFEAQKILVRILERDDPFASKAEAQRLLRELARAQ